MKFHSLEVAKLDHVDAGAHKTSSCAPRGHDMAQKLYASAIFADRAAYPYPGAAARQS
jgi:hypothetical protein